MMRFKSCAEWPEGSLATTRSNNITVDFHRTKEAATAVCRMLDRDGLGGEGKIFPTRTWVEPAPPKEER